MPEKAGLDDIFGAGSAMAGGACHTVSGCEYHGFCGFSLGWPPDKPRTMTHRVAAFYQFAALPDFRDLREPLRALCAALELKGSVLLAHEGINGTIAGSDEAVTAFVEALQQGPLSGGRLDRLELKYSTADAMPFQRLKVRL